MSDENKQCSFCGAGKESSRVLVRGAEGVVCNVCLNKINGLIKMNPDATLIEFRVPEGGSVT